MNQLNIAMRSRLAGLAHSSEQEHQTHHRHQQAQAHYAQELDKDSAPAAREGVPQGVQDHRRQESTTHPPIQRSMPYLEPFPPQDGAHPSRSTTYARQAR